MIIKLSDEKDFVQPKLGLTHGVITSFVDVGSSPNKFKDGALQRDVMIVITLPKQQDEEGNNLTISKWFTASMHTKSNLYAFVSSLVTVDSDLDLSVLLGVNLMVHIGERTKDNGDKRTEVVSVAPLMEDMSPITDLPTSKFELENFSQSEFDALSDKMQERIKLTPEFKAINNTQLDGYPE